MIHIYAFILLIPQNQNAFGSTVAADEMTCHHQMVWSWDYHTHQSWWILYLHPGSLTQGLDEDVILRTE